MKVKVLWGFEGDPDKVKINNGRIAAGETLDLEDEEYAYQLIGKGLAVLEDGSAPSKSGRSAKPNETK